MLLVRMCLYPLLSYRFLYSPLSSRTPFLSLFVLPLFDTTADSLLAHPFLTRSPLSSSYVPSLSLPPFLGMCSFLKPKSFIGLLRFESDFEKVVRRELEKR